MVGLLSSPVCETTLGSGIGADQSPSAVRTLPVTATLRPVAWHGRPVCLRGSGSGPVSRHCESKGGPAGRHTVMSGLVASGWLAAATTGVCLACLLIGSCAPRTPGPPLGPHTAADTPQQVTELPDTVSVEWLPPQPAEDTVWVDGSWGWSGRRWNGVLGSWQRRPNGAYYAEAAIIRLPAPPPEGGDAGLVPYGMQLLYIPGHWHLPDGGTMGAAPGDGGAQ